MARRARLVELDSSLADPDAFFAGETGAERDLIDGLTFDDWLWNIRQILASGITRWDLELRPELATHTLSETQKYLVDRDQPLFGLDLKDPRFLLRAAVEAASAESEVIQDLSDVVSAGYYSPAARVAEDSRLQLRSSLGADVPTVVLTEGRSDSELLSGALSILLPHLTDYYSFLDFESFGVVGGAGSLVTSVRAFIAARIANRVVALFDNDAAAAAAMRPLQRIALPSTIRVLQLPPLPLGVRYPTIGPTGAADSDVNGCAGSLELYFGEDVLTQMDGKPVLWKTYEPSVGRYQGELSDKARLQDAFRAKLESALDGHPPNGDWSGMRLILSALVNAFAHGSPVSVTAYPTL